MQFRDLNENDIEVRIAMVKPNGISLLLYKNARVDMAILDETVGQFGWQREHNEYKGNLYCGISIYDENKKQWVTKWDCGTESYTEKEKGEASDSFKRAGFNWGIGRELYTSPFIWITSSNCSIKEGKCYDRFSVSHIKIEDKQITELNIYNTSTGVECFTWKLPAKEQPIVDKVITVSEAKMLEKIMLDKGITQDQIQSTLEQNYNVKKLPDLKYSQYSQILRKLNKE